MSHDDARQLIDAVYYLAFILRSLLVIIWVGIGMMLVVLSPTTLKVRVVK